MSGSGNIRITGVLTNPDPNGACPLRREIRDLETNAKDLFNLFILGMRDFQALKEDELTSYYQICGIHGEPFKPWDNVPGLPGNDWDFGGYCTHSSVLFVTWHRPYLALFEQVLYTIIQGVAKKFPPSIRDRYQKAAIDFRLPYYDWALQPAAGSPAFPTSLSSPEISAVDVDGTTKNMANPLYQFNFHPVNPSPGDIDTNWSGYPSTVRYPDASGKSRDSMVAAVLANESGSLSRNVYLILTSPAYKTFDAFSNNLWRTKNSPGNFGSLEDIHNEIHDKTGGGGHMGALEVAAFDALFWLHHCNVDRLWAIWQDLNPDSFIVPEPAQSSNFSTLQDTMQTADTGLSPFWDKTGQRFWTSKGVENSREFNYAYPETQKWEYKDAPSYENALKQAVNRLYGPKIIHTVTGTGAGTPSQPAPAQQPQQPQQKQQKQQQGTKIADTAAVQLGLAGEKIAGVARDLAHRVAGDKSIEWILNMEVVKHGLGEAFRLLVFVGDIGADPAGWVLEKNCVGRVSVLARHQTSRCQNCHDHRARDLKVTGTVPLTLALVEDTLAGKLASLQPEHVVPYLRENLKCCITKFSGDVPVPLDEVPGLKISVCSVDVTIADDGTPRYSGEYRVHPEIMAGRPGGLSGNDEL